MARPRAKKLPHRVTRLATYMLHTCYSTCSHSSSAATPGRNPCSQYINSVLVSQDVTRTCATFENIEQQACQVAKRPTGREITRGNNMVENTVVLLDCLRGLRIGATALLLTLPIVLSTSWLSSLPSATKRHAQGSLPRAAATHDPASTPHAHHGLLAVRVTHAPDIP